MIVYYLFFYYLINLLLELKSFITLVTLFRTHIFIQVTPNNTHPSPKGTLFEPVSRIQISATMFSSYITKSRSIGQKMV